ncbi:MAG TPA: hypothetical protein IGS53_17325 [Leptolyngbyaceae cyanobacterium M33_DOE_097]|uniref:Uncharacterized protein n=1 Tax=Oscillatoriales cyanobacterium SpSt-418 TaxID=2282169 RepID=A0A7C3PJQ2_9CYAN|nr:hypothetical protein [Leptolyngbyaceae cyanobacterium M33_DOE_097]
MYLSVIHLPRFHKGQNVCFIGGEGTVQGYEFKEGAWLYQVKMEMGPEPVFGRVGYETTIVLAEAELKA